jgi:hypothetical protein
MTLVEKEATTVPKAFTLNFTKDLVPMHIFSETPQGMGTLSVWQISHVSFFQVLRYLKEDVKNLQICLVASALVLG